MATDIFRVIGKEGEDDGIDFPHNVIYTKRMEMLGDEWCGHKVITIVEFSNNISNNNRWVISNNDLYYDLSRVIEW